MGRTVDHRGVHHLTPAGRAASDECGEHPDHEVERPAREVTDHRHRSHRPLRWAERVQRARDGRVRDVVPGPLRPRAGLSPAGHPGVHQPGVSLEALGGTEAEPLDHARPVALDEHVGTVDEPLHDGTPGIGLEVNGDARP